MKAGWRYLQQTDDLWDVFFWQNDLLKKICSHVPHLDTIIFAEATHGESKIPRGLAELLPVEPREVDTHVLHCTPIQWLNPAGSPRSTATKAALD